MMIGANIAYESVLSSFNKDVTLTGRTYLWVNGIDAFLQNPWIGVGYQAFWVQSNPEAMRLYEEFFITSYSGFHFHNIYIEILVELGIIGIVLYLALIISSFWKIFVRVCFIVDKNAIMMLSLLMMFLVRSIAEVDFLTQYAIGSFIIFWIHATQDLQVLKSAGKGARQLGLTSRTIRDMSDDGRRGNDAPGIHRPSDQADGGEVHGVLGRG